MRIVPLLAWLSVAMVWPIHADAQSTDVGPLPDSMLVPDTAWYDGDAGTIKPVPVPAERADSAHRDSRWLPGADPVSRSRNTTTAAPTGGGGSTGIGQVIGWILIAAVLIAVVAAVLYAFKTSDLDLVSPMGRRALARNRLDDEMMERMRELPVELPTEGVDPRSSAERLMKVGQFDAAIVMLYGHQLLMLDRHGYLRLSRGKTNNRYVRETRTSDVTVAGMLRDTVDAFERSYFGRHAISATRFNLLWKNNLKLEQAVEASLEAAA